MKVKSLLILLSTLLPLAYAITPVAASTFADDTVWKKVLIEPAGAEIKPAFNESDPVQVTITEQLPNLCYRPAPIESRVDIESRRVILSDYAFLRASDYCPMMMLPITRTIEIGRLPAGNWELWINMPEEQNHKAGEFLVM